MKEGDKVGITACSDPMRPSFEYDRKRLAELLRGMGLLPVFSDFIYERSPFFSGSGRERADALMRFYRDPEIRGIFDISGGDMANELLPYLDFDLIRDTDKTFWGYSDLTTILNAITASTGKESMLYQIRNLLSDGESEKNCVDGDRRDESRVNRPAGVIVSNNGKHITSGVEAAGESTSQQRLREFRETIFGESRALCEFDYEMVQGTSMDGILVGGNIRCLLKLAGTGFWPDMDGKILLLEAYGGRVPQMVTYLSQLRLMGVFDRIQGILLGTFTRLEEEGDRSGIVELVQSCAGREIPIARTAQIGHGTDSKAAVIGGMIYLK